MLDIIMNHTTLQVGRVTTGMPPFLYFCCRCLHSIVFRPNRKHTGQQLQNFTHKASRKNRSAYHPQENHDRQSPPPMHHYEPAIHHNLPEVMWARHPLKQPTPGQLVFKRTILPTCFPRAAVFCGRLLLSLLLLHMTS